MATTTRHRATLFALPNQLTASRLALAVVLFVLIEYKVWLWCLVVFALAALTDWLDGYLARVQGLASALGRAFDPLVDKVLMCGAFIFLLPVGDQEGWLKEWMVVVIVSRELLVTGLRGYFESVGVAFGADWLGKLKMGLQCAALCAIFLVKHLANDDLALLRDVLIWLMLAATILSGMQYFWRGGAHLMGSADPNPL
jgi:CDP-diacylglycerol--glycerol-3-phosphate 3-phosphatidyltransferase